MIGFELLRPGLLWLLLLALAILPITLAALRRSRAELARWSAEQNAVRFVPGFSRARAGLRVALGALALFFLGLAALGPVRGFTYRAVSRKGLDLVLALDTSRSMLAQDLRPSRLERAKREVVGLLDHLAGDRVALVAFSGDARDVAPLTRDRSTLESLLAFVTTEDNHLGGTNLAAAIEHALSLFDGRTGAHEAVVLLTDGEDLEGQGSELAEEAQRRGIRIYVVGIGTEAGGKIPVPDADGRQTFLRDPEGNEVVTRLDRTSLEALAQRTGGAYLSAEESPTPLEELYRERISRIEGREIEAGERRVPYDRFQWPLALGVACLALELGLRERGAKRADKSTRARLAAAFLPLALVAGEERFSFERSLANAERHHRSGEPEAAEQAARALLEGADTLELSEIQRAEAHYALGVITATRASESESPAEALPDWSAAEGAFAAARALAGPGELRLDATYDLGTSVLLQAERVRATIPEVSRQAPAAPPPSAPQAGLPGPGGPTGEEEPDPLAQARTYYREAQGWLVERLRADWRDADVRANLELIQRRLDELDEIEKQRQEQEPEQQQDQDQRPQDQQQDESEDQEQQDPQDSDQQGEPEDPDSKEPEDEEPQEQPEEQPGEEEQEQQGQQEPQPEPGEEQPAGQEERPAEEKPAERVLTREEVMQLLDKLAELEKQQKALEAALRARRRGAVKRDW